MGFIYPAEKSCLPKNISSRGWWFRISTIETWLPTVLIWVTNILLFDDVSDIQDSSPRETVAGQSGWCVCLLCFEEVLGSWDSPSTPQYCLWWTSQIRGSPSASIFTFIPGRSARLHFLDSPAGDYGHVTEFQPIKWEQRCSRPLSSTVRGEHLYGWLETTTPGQPWKPQWITEKWLSYRSLTGILRTLSTVNLYKPPGFWLAVVFPAPEQCLAQSAYHPI